MRRTNVDDVEAFVEPDEVEHVVPLADTSSACRALSHSQADSDSRWYGDALHQASYTCKRT